ALQAALGKILERHKVLRLRFSGDGASLSAEDAGTQHVEIRQLSAGEKDLPGILLEEENRRFDLKEAPLFRAALIKLGEKERALILAAHEIVADDVSLHIIFNELNELYETSRAGKHGALPEPRRQDSEFGAWQRKQAEDKDWAEHLEFWRNELK